MRKLCRLAAAVAVLAGSLAARAQETAPSDPSSRPVPVQAPAPQAAFSGEIEVVGQSPLHGAGTDSDHVAGNVREVRSADLKAAQPHDVVDFLSGRLGSVAANDTEGNSFEQDLQFRGFAASPVLGSPQGLAVFQDGVRLNEPFGDTVDWDLVPLSAIASLALIPGSNPLFGLNAQGGVLDLVTKTGLTAPGIEAAVGADSFGGRSLALSAGHSWGPANLFVATDLDGEDGWRDHSASDVRQLFADFGWAGSRGGADLSVSGARNLLRGNGATPVQLLAVDRAAVFTFPDQADREAVLVAGRFRFAASPAVLLEGNAYGRRLLTDSVNGDASPYSPCEDDADAGFLCTEDGARVRDQHGTFVPLGTAPGAPPLDGVRNGSHLDQTAYGGAFQATASQPLAGHRNELLAGASLDVGSALFDSRSELANLTADRGTNGVGLFALDSFVRVGSRFDKLGLFAADTFFPLAPLAVQVAARLDSAGVRLTDELGGDLSGDHRFQRLDPALSLTYSPAAGRSLYATYAESSRAPNPVELTCADPDKTCRLPNAFVADPPLAQVVTRTVELGGRCRRAGLRWSFAVYRAVSDDDILFVNSGTLLGQGYFKNVGRTRRQGLEADLGGTLARWVGWYLSYALTDATFQTPFSAASPDNPFSTDGAIDVAAGARLPGVPRHSLKGGFQIGDFRRSAGLSAAWSSPRFLRGDEANLDRPLPGFVVVDATGRWALPRGVALVGRVSNLLARRYATFGAYGEPAEVLGPGFDDPRFLVPGPPRAFRLAIEVSR